MKRSLALLFLLTVGCSKSVNYLPPVVCSSDEILSSGSCLKTDFRLNKNPMAAGSRSSEKFQKTSDGTKIVYISDEDTLGQDELYVVDLEGGGKQKISQALIADGDVSSFVISPNSQKVAFLADASEDGKANLYTVDLDGSNLAQVNAGVPTVAHVVADTYKFMPNSQKLVFVTDEQSVAGDYDLLIANLDGSGRIPLNVTAPGNGRVNLKFEISPSGRIAYPSVATGSNNEWIMSSVLSDASGYRRLSALTATSSRTVQQDAFLITPNGSKVVYLSTAADPFKKELYSIDIDALYPTSEVKISAVVVANGNVDGSTGVMFQSTADSSKIIFAGDVTTDNIKELYSVGVNGGAVTKLNGPMVLGQNVASFKIASNSQDLLYVSDESVDGINDLFHTSLVSPAVVKVNSLLASGGNVVDYQHDSTGRAVYIHNKGGVYNLYSRQYMVGSELKINDSSFQSVYDVISPKKEQFVVEGSLVLFRQGATYDLYKVNSDGSDLKRVHRKEHTSDVVISDSANGQNFFSVGSYIVYRVIEAGQKVLYSSKQ